MSNSVEKIRGIYAITPNQILDIKLIEQVITQHSIGILQYRHKTNNTEVKLNEAQQLRQLCSEHNTLFIINDDINLAQKVNADGVHLGKEDASIATARQHLGENAIIGVSCYNDLKLAQSAEAARCKLRGLWCTIHFKHQTWRTCLLT